MSEMKPEVTYVFEGNNAYAIRAGKVIASASDVDTLEHKIAEMFPPPPDDLGGAPLAPSQDEMGLAQGSPVDSQASCEGCGGLLQPEDAFCSQCGNPVADAGADPGAGNPLDDGGMAYGDPGDEFSDHGPIQASITTPNGLTGTVLGKVAGVWGDEVTVRLENGRIVRLPVNKEMKFAKADKPLYRHGESINPIKGLEARIAATVDGTRDSLVERIAALEEVVSEASSLIREGVSHTDSIRLDEIRVTADTEIAEVSDALAHLDDEATQAYSAPSFSMGAAHEAAASMNGVDGSWLDHTANEMIAEAEATDFKQLMDEGPEAFAAELPDEGLADAGVVRQMAASYIRTKTAGTDQSVRDPYEKTWIGRVEQCRRAELATRKVTTKKEAAATEDKFTNLPDDHFFV